MGVVSAMMCLNSVCFSFQLEFIPDQFWIIILLIIVLLNLFVSCLLYPITFTVTQRAVVFPLNFSFLN